MEIIPIFFFLIKNREIIIVEENVIKIKVRSK